VRKSSPPGQAEQDDLRLAVLVDRARLQIGLVQSILPSVNAVFIALRINKMNRETLQQITTSKLIGAADCSSIGLVVRQALIPRRVRPWCRAGPDPAGEGNFLNGLTHQQFDTLVLIWFSRWCALLPLVVAVHKLGSSRSTALWSRRLPGGPCLQTASRLTDQKLQPQAIRHAASDQHRALQVKRAAPGLALLCRDAKAYAERDKFRTLIAPHLHMAR
jgi:hypothetical protein